MRWLTAGESHGPSLVAILEGLPAHVRVTSDDIREALARRRLGYGRGARMKFEQDEVTLVGGIRHGETQGGPVAIQIGNTEWPKWDKVMSADPVDPVRAGGLGAQRAADQAAPGPRGPGRHAEVRLRRGPADPGARLGPRDRGAGGAGPGGLQLPRAGGRCPGGVARDRARRRARPRRALAGARGRRPARRRPGALPRRRHQQADGRAGSTRPTRTATPSVVWSRSSCTGCRRGSGRTCTGTAGSTPGSPAP